MNHKLIAELRDRQRVIHGICALHQSSPRETSKEIIKVLMEEDQEIDDQSEWP